MYEFTKDCMLNIEQLDNEHKRLFQMINEAISLVEHTDDISTISKNLIANLKDYAATHFAHEEAYMEKDVEQYATPLPLMSTDDMVHAILSNNFS